MKLTREQRAAVFAGEAPRIAGEGECPWKPGDIYRASSKVELEVLEIRPVKPRWRNGEWQEAGWSLHYVIRDQRDSPRLLRPNPHPVDFDAIRASFDEYGYPPDDPGDPEAMRGAGVESAYTTRPGAGLRRADEGVGEGWLKRFSEEGGARLQKERQQEYNRKMARSRAAALKEVELRARQRGIDVSPELRTIGEEVEKMRRKLDDDGQKAA